MGRLTIRQPGRQYKNREFYAHAILTVTKRLIGKGVLYRPSFPRFFRIESPLISMRWALCAGNNSCYQPLGIGPGFGGHLRKLRFLFGCGMYFHDSSAGKPGVVLRSTRAFGARIMVPEIRALSERQIQFEWDEIKAAANERKHGITFEVASTVFRDPNSSLLPMWHTAKRRTAGSPSAGRAMARFFPLCTYGSSPAPRRRKSA